MTLVMKTVVVLFLISIFFSLGSALYFLMTDKGQSERIVKALTWRIGLSFVLFVLLLIAYALGWLVPHSI